MNFQWTFKLISEEKGIDVNFFKIQVFNEI